MEREFYTDEFEQLIKEKSDQFRMYPSKRVWHSIYNNLHPSRRWPSFAIFILFLGSLVSIGYLNTSDNSRNFKFGAGIASTSSTEKTNSENDNSKPATQANNNRSVQPVTVTIGIPQAETPALAANQNNTSIAAVVNSSTRTERLAARNPKNKQTMSSSVSSNKGRVDDQLAVRTNSKQPVKGIQKPVVGVSQADAEESSETEKDLMVDKAPAVNTTVKSPAAASNTEKSMAAIAEAENKPVLKPTISEVNADVQEEKSWIENYAQQNKPAGKKWKDRLDLEIYATPAVNYRKLSAESKGSNAPFAMTGDINKAISQRPGLGIETGVGVSYAFAKNLRLKAGLQFNYTNYNINADRTSHPIQTTVLMTDPATGYTYPVARTSTIANTYDNAQQPVTLHNRTYQVSVPVGLAYKLSSNKNVEWFAGATVQPSYIFGGKAHLISSDLKNYVEDASSIRNWNLNVGLETYMNYRLGKYNFRVGPQVRYQVYSTYRKNVALIEKPYAVGMKFGLIKSF